MTKKRDARILLGYAKKIISKGTYKKLKKIKDLDEKKQIAAHLLKHTLESSVETLKHTAVLIKKQGINTFSLDTKICLLSAKIKLFNATHNKKDFAAVRKLFKKIEKEIKHV